MSAKRARNNRCDCTGIGHHGAGWQEQGAQPPFARRPGDSRPQPWLAAPSCNCSSWPSAEARTAQAPRHTQAWPVCVAWSSRCATLTVRHALALELQSAFQVIFAELAAQGNTMTLLGKLPSALLHVDTDIQMPVLAYG